MGNLSFAHNAGFSWYCILLMLAGITMLVLGVVRAQPASRRIIRVIFGIGFFCYGFYLTFIFGGGHYVLFFQAFILPALLIVDFFRTRTARRTATAGAPHPVGRHSGLSGAAGGAGTDDA